MPSVPLPGAVGWIAGGLGLSGLLVVVFGSRVRSFPSLGLIASFVLMTIGGALLTRSTDATRPWGAALVLAGGAGGCLVAALLVRRDLRLSREAEAARNAAATTRRDLDAQETTLHKVEGQLLAAQKRIQELLEKMDTDAGGDPARMEQYRARIRKLKASEEKLRQVIDLGRDGVILLENETLRMAQFSPGVARMTGLAPEELVQRSLLDLLEKGPAAPGRTDLQRSAHERRPVDAKLIRADGTRLPVRIAVHAVGGEDDAQLAALVTDESGSERQSDQLDELREELSARERHLDDLRAERAAGMTRIDRLERELTALRSAGDRAVEAVAHDLRVPLTSVRSFSEILLRHDDAPACEQREFLNVIREESERLTSMIDELLDVHRVRKAEGDEGLRRDELDLREVVRAAIASVGELARDRGVEFAGVWERDARRVRGERDRLQRMLVILLTNAVAQSSEGGTVEVLLRDGGDQGAALLGIRDHGRADADEGDGDIVFERFHPASEGPDQAPGNGVGMSICREIAAAHGARMWPEARGAGGKTLWIEFPHAEQPAGDLADAVSTAAG